MLVPVILAGGKGTRLWPVSRELRPKPFLALGERCLLQSAMLQAASLAPSHIVISTNEDCYFQCEEALEPIHQDLAGVEVHYQLEPESRDTAASVRMVAEYASEAISPDALLLIMPCDQVIADSGRFRAAVTHACSVAVNKPVVEFHPAAAGAGAALANNTAAGATPVSSMYCLRAHDAREVFKKCAPAIELAVRTAWQEAKELPGRKGRRLNGAAFHTMPALRLDEVFSAPACEMTVLEEDFDCLEIRSWNELAQLYSPDAFGNTIDGEALLLQTRNTHVQSDGRLVAAVGVDNLVIVDTPDALLVGSREHASRIGQVARRLRREGHEAGRLHRTVHRPWGTYSVLGEGENFKIKRLAVKPGAALSLQMHQHRSEHWVVVAGTASVINGEREFILHREENTVIPAGNRHRLENVGDVELVVIETQTGDYLGEDDIVRFEDRYGRTESRAH